MSVGIVGTPHINGSSGNSTTAKTGDAGAKPAGSNLLCHVGVFRPYCNDATAFLPSTMTLGGQTLSRQLVFDSAANIGAAYYKSTRAQASAISGGSYTITYGSTLAAAYQTLVIVVWTADSAETLQDSEISPDLFTPDRSLTTVSGNLCLIFGGERGDQSGLTLGSGMTDGSTNYTGGSGIGDTNGRMDSRVATTTSTALEVGSDASELTATFAIAITEDVGGGGGGSGNSDDTAATQRGVLRGHLRGMAA